MVVVGEGEADAVVALIEDGVVLAEESITENDGGTEFLGEFKNLESEQTLRLTVIGDLDDVVGSEELVAITADVEGEGRVLFVHVAVDGLGEELDNGCEDDGVTDNKTGAAVNNDGVELDVEMSNGDGISGDNVPGLEDDGVVLNRTDEESLINTTEDKFGSITVVGTRKVEREDVLSNDTLLNEHIEEGSSLAGSDLLVSETEDTVSLGAHELKSELVNAGQSHLGSKEASH